ncbi:hypothetical protein [Croceibacterium ferulae]|uniref:hypothetical protein n=1 Tax=Croceibacterium ferulae TaxID=1854641 RepID=UPI0012D83DB1|nr:hypothetical protein [Croceibacterium ferulae]
MRAYSSVAELRAGFHPFGSGETLTVDRRHRCRELIVAAAGVEAGSVVLLAVDER